MRRQFAHLGELRGGRLLQMDMLARLEREQGMRRVIAHLGFHGHHLSAPLKSDSWYFGVDNFGLYSIADAVASPPLSFQREGNSLVISWPAEAGGFTLEQSSSVTGPDWSPTPGATGNTATVSIGDGTVFYRLGR
jgi:hypothetical protein